MPIGFEPLMRIDGREIGPSRPVFIIAEIGINHNGSIELAREMIRSAKACGVDCVKFQSFRADEFMAARGIQYRYSSGGREVVEDMYEMFARLELPASWHAELFHYARQLDLIPLTSVADSISVEVALAAGSTAFKLASEDLINLELIECVAAKGKPLILSTGMADGEEVQDALSILRRHGISEVALLHCVSLYPAPDDEIRLNRMLAIAGEGNAIVGYSDHSDGITAVMGAVALGACIIEKHFTTDRNLDGPDHALSSDPEEMQRMVEEIRRMEQMRGSPGDGIAPSRSELKMRALFRRSLVAATDLPAGTEIGRQHLEFKRAGTEGLRYRDIKLLLGGTLRHGIQKGRPIIPADLKGKGDEIEQPI